MTKNRVITAIDLGTDKCVTLIATVGEDKQLRVVGVSAVPARGMKRSVIVDLEQVLNTISLSLDAAERMAGFEVVSAFVSVSGAHISSRNSKGVVAVASPDQEITRLDVDRVIEAARAISLPADREIMHVIPRDFKVDSQEGIKDPVGMTGVRLESEAHIITGMSTALKNLEKCLNDLALKVDGFVFSGLASAEVTVTETEKELGVMVIDLGAGSTSLCAYVDGCLEFSGAIPVGARHVTQDIALGCRISLDAAEKIKLSLVEADLQSISPLPGESKEELNRRRKKSDVLDLTRLDLPELSEPLSKRTLVEGIMIPRMKEIVDIIAEQMAKADLMGKVPAGLVLTGGGALTVKLAEVARKNLNLPVRVGFPTKLDGLVSDIEKPSYATSIGLLFHGLRQGGGREVKGGSPFEALSGWFDPKGLGGKIWGIIKSVLP
ncbi:MAG TPA: cell division protein FtsA [Candidatus Pacebacteria bacterium]|nr:cell division protein FtsA [Candidatus Paceibacterota bacterium]